ncbi:hypothetical protein AAC387_Pa12g1585 [Persea americana]
MKALLQSSVGRWNSWATLPNVIFPDSCGKGWVREGVCSVEGWALINKKNAFGWEMFHFESIARMSEVLQMCIFPEILDIVINYQICMKIF